MGPGEVWVGQGLGQGSSIALGYRVGGGKGQPERFGLVCIGQLLGSRPMGSKKSQEDQIVKGMP